MGFASEDALTGLGMKGELAALVGDSANLQSGHGTAQSGATVLLNNSAELNPSSGNTAFVLQALYQNLPCWVFNSQSTTAVVFVPAGHTLNGSLNGSLSVAQNKGAVLWQYKYQFWASVLSN